MKVAICLDGKTRHTDETAVDSKKIKNLRVSRCRAHMRAEARDRRDE